MPQPRRSRRVQFLPQVPSGDIGKWVENLRTRGPRLEPGDNRFAVCSAGNPSQNSNSNDEAEHKRRRKDFPLLRSVEKGAASDAMSRCETPAQMKNALNELVRDMYAASSRAPRDALLNTWIKFHERWYGQETPVLPLTEEKALRVASFFKKGGYKSVKNYFSRVKDYHISEGHDWTDKLDTIVKKCTRSVLRGLGGAHRSEQFDFLEVVKATQHLVNALDEQGPVNPSALITVATLFLLREVEASAVDLSDVTLTDSAVTLKLPVSKVDWQAKVALERGTVCVTKVCLVLFMSSRSTLTSCRRPSRPRTFRCSPRRWEAPARNKA